MVFEVETGEHFDCADTSNRRELEDVQDALELCLSSRHFVRWSRTGHCEIVICPSFLDLAAAVTATAERSHRWRAEFALARRAPLRGGFRGAEGVRLSHVIVGHNERREYFGSPTEC